MNISNEQPKAMWTQLSSLWMATPWQTLLGDLSHMLAPERLGPWVTERIFWRAHTPEKIVALSFDDGPNDKYTTQLLDILTHHRIPATFFLIGRNVKRFPAVARRIIGDGHEVGNHTFSHRMLPLLQDEEIVRELCRTHEIIAETTGIEATFLRPPMGLFTRRVVTVAENSGYRTVVGDVYPRDPNLPGTRRIVKRVLARVQPGSLIILHDGGNAGNIDRQQTVESVRAIIPNLLCAGYRFVTLSALVQAHSESMPA